MPSCVWRGEKRGVEVLLLAKLRLEMAVIYKMRESHWLARTDHSQERQIHFKRDHKHPQRTGHAFIHYGLILDASPAYAELLGRT
jgi:hypothetical protein